MDRVLPWATRLSACLVLLACGGSEDRPPFSFDNGPAEDSAAGAEPACTIYKPGDGRILKGSMDIKVGVEDPENAGFKRVVFAFKTDDGVVKLGDDVTQVPADGMITRTQDIASVADGKHLFVCQVETADDRVGVAAVSVTVDNLPPVVKLDSSATPPGGNFIGDLVISFKVDDGPGTGVSEVFISVNDSPVASPPSPFPPGQAITVIVPGKELQSGENTVKLWAVDLADNESEPLEYVVNFVPSPDLAQGLYVDLPKDAAVAMIEGLVVGGRGMVAAAGQNGVELYGLTDQNALEEAGRIWSEATSHLLVADMNADGLDDLLVVTGTQGDVSTLRVLLQLEQGESPFAEAWNAQVDGKVIDVAVGRINNDAIPDIAVAVEGSGPSVGVAVSSDDGDGGPTWGTVQGYEGVTSPALIGVGDFTGDGAGDIIVTRSSSPTVTVFPADPDTGELSIGVNTALDDPTSGKSFSGMVVGSWDPSVDGAVAVFLEPKERVVFRATGTGMTGKLNKQYGSWGTGLAPSALKAGDIDGDGLDDLAVLCPSSNMVEILWGSSTSVFEEGHVALMSGNSATDVALSDMNGDGRLDVLVLNSGNKRLGYIPFDSSVEDGSRRFVGPVLVRTAVKPLAIAAGVFTLPLEVLAGFKDLAILGLSEEDNANKVLFLVADEHQRLPVEFTSNAPLEPGVLGTVGILAADLDGNGYDDLLLPSTTVSPADKHLPTMGRFLMNEGASHFFASTRAGVDPTTGEQWNKGFYAGDAPTVAVIADLRRDPGGQTKLDLGVVARFNVGLPEAPQMELLFQTFDGNGDGSFTMHSNPPYEIEPGKTPSALAADRLTGKVNIDVVMANKDSGDLRLYFAKGLGLFYGEVGEYVDYAVGSNPRDVAVDYLDAPKGSTEDPFPDIVTLLANDAAVSYAVQALDKPHGIDYEPPVYLGYTGSEPVDLELADMNGDGYPDIVILDRADSTVTVYLNLAQAGFSRPFVFDVGMNPVGMVVRDLDSDGCPDVATADNGGYSVTILRNLVCGG